MALRSLKRVGLGLVAVAFLSVGIALVYLEWPAWFPRFPIGVCVEDLQVHRVFRVTSREDFFNGRKVSGLILRSGTVAPGTHQVGSEEWFNPYDPSVLEVACPSITKKNEIAVLPEKKHFQSRVYQQIQALSAERESRPSLKETLKQESTDLFRRFREFQMFQPDTAMALLSESLEKDPSNVEALAGMADELLGKGDMEQARKYAIECLAVSARNSVCHRTLISTYTRQGDFEEAYPYLADCIEVDPTNEYCIGGMVSYQLHAGNLNEAKGYADRLRKVAPGSLWSHLSQAEYFDAAGDKGGARLHYEAACKLGQPYACNRLKAF